MTEDEAAREVEGVDQEVATVDVAHRGVEEVDEAAASPAQRADRK